MKIGITGSSGFIGSHLCKFLKTLSYAVVPITRGCFDNLEGFDCIIHLSGENIAAKRWTEGYKKKLEESRVETTKSLCQALSTLKNPPKILLVASAVGFYGDRGDETLDETSSPGNTFLSNLCQEWQKAAKTEIRTVFMRFGLILSNDGGALPKMIAVFKAGLGAKFGSGKQYMSWITLDDLMLAINHILIHTHLSGPINFVAPYPITNEKFTKTLAKVLKRPTFLSIPPFMIKLLFGQKGEELFLSSARVLPKALIKSEFSFKFPTIEEALQYLTK